MTETCLILLAHGSRDPRWRAPFEHLWATLQDTFGRRRAKLAYLEFVSPTLQEAAEEARREGAAHLRILPLFMAGGGHVDRDLPGRAELIRQQFPGIEVEILPAAGEHPKMIRALQEIAFEAVAEDPS